MYDICALFVSWILLTGGKFMKKSYYFFRSPRDDDDRAPQRTVAACRLPAVGGAFDDRPISHALVICHNYPPRVQGLTQRARTVMAAR